MSIKKDHTGRRWVEVEIEVPGTPEEVWEAIATGPGISSWFVPTEFADGADGKPVKVVAHIAPDNSMDSVADVVEWEPPHRFKATSKDLGPDAPEIATEWIVEARSGSTCTVRVVHSLVTDTDDWDNQLGSWESGWPWFLQILRLSLLDFRNQPCRAFRIMGATGGDPAQAWAYFIKAIGLKECAIGSLCQAPGGMPPLIGRVKKVGAPGGHHHAALVRLDEPCAGILSTFAMPMGDAVYLVLDFFLYGKRAEEAAARWEPRWQAWMAERYPMPEDEGRQGGWLPA